MPTIELMADIEILKAQVACLEGEKAALEALLREAKRIIRHMPPGSGVPREEEEAWFKQVLAALSGDGKGWLPPDKVVEDVIDDIYCALHLIPREGSAPDYLKDAIEKLAALGGK